MKTKHVALILSGIIIVVISAIIILSKSKKNDQAQKEKSELARKTEATKSTNGFSKEFNQL